MNVNACGLYFRVVVWGRRGKHLCRCVCDRIVFTDKRDEAAITSSVPIFTEGSVSGERGCFGSVFEFGHLNGGDVYVVSAKELF